MKAPSDCDTHLFQQHMKQAASQSVANVAESTAECTLVVWRINGFQFDLASNLRLLILGARFCWKLAVGLESERLDDEQDRNP